MIRCCWSIFQKLVDMAFQLRRYLDELSQDLGNSSALAMELL